MNKKFIGGEIFRIEVKLYFYLFSGVWIESLNLGGLGRSFVNKRPIEYAAPTGRLPEQVSVLDHYRHHFGGGRLIRAKIVETAKKCHSKRFGMEELILLIAF